MNIVVVGHPEGFLGSQSMPRMVQMIANGMRERGHAVQIWHAKPVLARLARSAQMKKWLGYFDQFVLFSAQMIWRARQLPSDTVFVFTDQALGPWIRWVRDRPHVVHLNDFLAIRSALGEFPQNPTGLTGRVYQSLILNGLKHGSRFICISDRTQQDLLRLTGKPPHASQVVHLCMNHPYRRLDRVEAMQTLPHDARERFNQAGMLLHVGGNQWYKNRVGVIALYAAYVAKSDRPLPLWMIGASPTEELKILAKKVTPPGEIHFYSGWDNEALCAAYSLAQLMVFPSLAEGFGWPIIESMACGCPVLTTAVAPMTEVGGAAASYLPLMPSDERSQREWAILGGAKIKTMLEGESGVRERQMVELMTHADSFKRDIVLKQYEGAYSLAIKSSFISAATT